MIEEGRISSIFINQEQFQITSSIWNHLLLIEIEKCVKVMLWKWKEMALMRLTIDDLRFLYCKCINWWGCTGIIRTINSFDRLIASVFNKKNILQMAINYDTIPSTFTRRWQFSYHLINNFPSNLRSSIIWSLFSFYDN